MSCRFHPDLNLQRTQMAVPQTFWLGVVTINYWHPPPLPHPQSQKHQVIKYHHTNCCWRSLGPSAGERRGNRSMPFPVAGTGSTQARATCDPTKRPWYCAVQHHCGERVQGEEVGEMERQSVSWPGELAKAVLESSPR